MKTILAVCTLLISSLCFGEAKVGVAAPSFSEVDHAGKTHTLDTHKGKWVVLEWYNQDCPYVKKHYSKNNMQTLQGKYTEKGVVWLTVAGSAEGEQGYVAPKTAEAQYKTAGMKSTALLLDGDGTMGKAYGAKTTPHMFVIDPKGMLVYAGAIDSNNSSDASDIPKSTNYVAAALDEGMSGKPITIASKKAYGCSVKYK